MSKNVVSKITVGIPVYNESNTIKETIVSVDNSLSDNRLDKKSKIIVCLNGCTDNSEEIIKSIKKEISHEIIILHSEKGKLNAHKRIVDEIEEDTPILFLDGDVKLVKNTLKIMLDFFVSHQKVIIVGAYPYVNKSLEPKGIFKKAIFNIINFKRIYPEIEIATQDVKKYHPYAKNKFEERGRVYFHGRCFILRDKKYYNFPTEKSGVVGDDTFLSFSLLYNHGPGSITLLYNAMVISQPQMSLKSYLKTWYRIRKDLDKIYLAYPEFKKLKKIVRMRPNFGFIFYRISLYKRLYSVIFVLLRGFEYISYKLLSPFLNLERLWSYNSKEVYT